MTHTASASLAYQIRCDTHTHTIFSRHAYSTLEENCRKACDLGFELLGVSDHFSSMLFEQQTLKNFQHFLNMEIWPEMYGDLRLLKACEVDIEDASGSLFGERISLTHHITGRAMKHKHSLADLVFSQCDYLIASVHDKSFSYDRTPSQNAQTYIRALERPKVLILGHLGRSAVDFELDPVIRAARDLGKLIEVNEASLKGSKRGKSYERCKEILIRAAELSCPISFGSDAHISLEVGLSPNTQELLYEIDFPQELMSCSSCERFMSYVEKL